MSVRNRTWFALILALVLPAAVAAAWIPLRARYSNLDIALVLVMTVMAVGTTGSWPAAGVAAASAAWWFDFLDTKPYAQPTIASGPDLATFVVLGAVGGTAGVVTALACRRRRSDRVGDQDLLRLRTAAGLVATGSELVAVISAIAGQIASSLQLSDCVFDAEAVDPGQATVARDGTCSELTLLGASEWKLLLPVWAQGEVIGNFVLTGSERPPTRDRLLAALALADQAGAALAAYGVGPGPSAPGGSPRLRLVARTGDGPRPVPAAREPSGSTLRRLA